MLLGRGPVVSRALGFPRKGSKPSLPPVGAKRFAPLRGRCPSSNRPTMNSRGKSIPRPLFHTDPRFILRPIGGLAGPPGPVLPPGPVGEGPNPLADLAQQHAQFCAMAEFPAGRKDAHLSSVQRSAYFSAERPPIGCRWGTEFSVESLPASSEGRV